MCMGFDDPESLEGIGAASADDLAGANSASLGDGSSVALGKGNKPAKDINVKDAYVFIDFVFDDGLFYIAIENYSKTKPALNVTVHFDKSIHGVEGTKRINELPLFGNIEFLAPKKRIVAFLDTSTAYFKRGEPTVVTTTITYKDKLNASYSMMTKHDLGIYRELGYVRRVQTDDGRDEGSRPSQQYTLERRGAVFERKKRSL